MTDASLSLIAMSGASAMLLTVLVIFWRHHVPAYIDAFRLQSTALGIVGVVVAWRTHQPELFIVAGLILVFKAVIVPAILRRMEARVPTPVEANPMVNTAASLVIAGCLAVAAYEVARPVTAVVNLPTRGGLPLALAVIMVSLFVVVSRRQAMTQIVGFLMLENGIALLALLGAYGVPLVVELGVFLDVLMGVLVMQALVFRRHEAAEAAAAIDRRAS